MEAIYINDALRGRGYGRFRITELVLPLPDGVAYTLQRSSDGKHLGLTGWQDAAESLVPDEILPDTDGVCFAISPHVVNQLDEMENYRFAVLTGETSLRCRLEVSGVLYSDMDSSASIPESIIHKTVPVPPKVDTEPEREPVYSGELPPESLSFGAPTAPKKSHIVPILLCVVLALTLIGSGAYFLYDRSGAPLLPETETTPTVTPEVKTPEIKEPLTPPVPTPQPAPQPAKLSPMAQARNFLRGNGAAAEAISLGRSLPQASVEDQDAVFLLMEVAAEEGNPEAMVEVARFYNPADTTPSGTVIKDAEQSALWYKKAALNPATADAAAKGLTSLKAWLQQEVTKGSMNAKELLNRLQ